MRIFWPVPFPLSFILPELQPKDYGICHVDHELYDTENNLIQLLTESDGGRFSIYKVITPVIIKDAAYQWITVKDENVYWGQNAELTMHFKNTTNDKDNKFEIRNSKFETNSNGQNLNSRNKNKCPRKE